MAIGREGAPTTQYTGMLTAYLSVIVIQHSVPEGGNDAMGFLFIYLLFRSRH